MALNKTNHLKLNVFPQSAESVELVRDTLRAIAEDVPTSNMHIIDKAIADLEKKAGNNIVWSETRPESQAPGDTWNEIITM